MFTKQTIKDINVRHKTVLVRADYNVPLDGQGNIRDDYRIQQSVPTLRYLLDQEARLVIVSHLGRPSGPQDGQYSLFPVAKRLQQLLDVPVGFEPDCVGERVEKAVKALQPGGVLLLENLRFHKEEEANDEAFARRLADLADVFVQDGFGVVHRAHASTEAVTRSLPSVAGLLLEKEVSTIMTAMEKPTRPLMAIVGGAKIADKIEILHRFVDIADIVAIGGGMANTFLLAQGVDIAESLVAREDLPLARDIIKKAQAKAAKQRFVFYLPQDGVVAHKVDPAAPTRIVDWTAHVIADIESYPKKPASRYSHIAAHEMILDIGPFSASFMAGCMQLAGTVVWNGTMGVTETKGLQGPIGPTAHGTDLVIEAMTGEFGSRPFSVVGGGDTVGYLQNRGLLNAFNHVSTGGGASLELMAGRKLPGVEALRDK